MKYWEIIADNLSKAGWSLGILTGERIIFQTECFTTL